MGIELIRWNLPRFHVANDFVDSDEDQRDY